MDRRVTVYSKAPKSLVQLLEGHLPSSIALLRRLQFTCLDSGTTPTARICYCPKPTDDADPTQTTEDFAVSYIDFSRGPETEMWLYSTLEDDKTSKDHREESECQILAILDTVKAIARDYSGERAYPGAVVVGALHKDVYEVIERRGAGMYSIGECPTWKFQKWLFRVEDLPQDQTLPEGMSWDTADLQTCELAVSKNPYPRLPSSLMSYPSLVIKLDDGTPVVWSFLGADASLSVLHCEEPYRQQGLSKALSAKLFQDQANKFGSDGWCHADVATTNAASQSLLNSLNGRPAWVLDWVKLHLGV